jgi:hypothetical protein
MKYIALIPNISPPITLLNEYSDTQKKVSSVQWDKKFSGSQALASH